MTKRKRPPDVPSTENMVQIKNCLDQLKMTKIKELIEEEMSRLDKGKSSSPTEMLLRLLQAQVMIQRERRIERRIRESKMPERKTLLDFDFDFQPSLDKSQILELATMGFVARRQGVILAGKSGTGKSHIAKVLALQGCKEGYRVRYTTAADMLSMLYASLADDSLDQKLKRYLSPDLLVIDELGFDRLEQEDSRNASLFFKVIDGRYAKKSTVLTTNIDFEQLGHYLGDPVVTTAIVDRMVHHSTVITINGPSWRLKESEKLNKQTAKRKNHPGQAKNKPSKKPSSRE